MDEIRTEEGWQVGVQVYGGTTSAERSAAELKIIRRYHSLPSLEAENARLREALDTARKDILRAATRLDDAGLDESAREFRLDAKAAREALNEKKGSK